MRGRVRLFLVASALAGAAALVRATTRSESSTPTAPIAVVARPPTSVPGTIRAPPVATAPDRITGEILERARAGSYTYLRVRPDAAGDDVWIVLAEPPALIATMTRVDVRVTRRAEHFHSRRLNRDFALLFFATTNGAAAASRSPHPGDPT